MATLFDSIKHLFFYCLLANAFVATTADLEQICADKQIDLRRASQIDSLVKQLESNPDFATKCPQQTIEALKGLNDLINRNKRNVCSLDAVGRIRDYYDAYVSSSLHPQSNPDQTDYKLPKELKNFFLGYGLQVSSICKKNMIASLMYESGKLLEERDYELIEPWTNEMSLISQLMDQPSDYDDLLLPRDINQVIMDTHKNGGNQKTAEQSKSGEEKMFLQTATGHLIRRLKAICLRRFKPIYQHLILPLIFLSNMGFNYQGEELERELKEMSMNKELHQWYRIVYLCESFEGLEVVEEPEDTESQTEEGSDQRLVRILTPDEVAQLSTADKNEASFDSERAISTIADLMKLKQLEYKPEGSGIQLNDEIITEEDKNLMRLINSFATHKSELDRITARLMRKMARFLLNKLKHGQFKIVFGTMIDTFAEGAREKLGKQTTSADANSDLIEALNEYVDEAINPDGPVSGTGQRVKGLAKRYYHNTASSGLSNIKAGAKKAMNKVMIRKGFWYLVAVSLLLCGLISIIIHG